MLALREEEQGNMASSPIKKSKNFNIHVMSRGNMGPTGNGSVLRDKHAFTIVFAGLNGIRNSNEAEVQGIQ